MRIPKFYLALLAFFALCHLNSHAALSEVSFDLTAAFTSQNMSGYYANGHALSYQSPPGIITGGPLSSASTINSISKKVEIDGRSYTVAIEIKEIGSSLSKGFSIPQNTSYYPGIYLLFGTDITFDIYIY